MELHVFPINLQLIKINEKKKKRKKMVSFSEKYEEVVAMAPQI